MKFILPAIILLFVYVAYAAVDKPVVSMKAHLAAGIACVDCHETSVPAKRPPKSTCIACHDDGSGSYYGSVIPDVPGAGVRQVNPHNSHQGDIRCTLCHSYHKEPELMCNECHNYVLKVK